MNHWHIRLAALAIEHGGVIAYPTEAVYGLGCSPLQATAVARILTLKRRNPAKGLIIVASQMEQLEEYADFAQVPNEAIFSSWPGPVTWVLPAKKGVPSWLTGRHGSIAVRVSAHPVVRELCDLVGPLISTSANPAGASPALRPLRVRTYFGNKIDYILPDKVGSLSGPTEIREAKSGQILRQGH